MSKTKLLVGIMVLVWALSAGEAMLIVRGLNTRLDAANAEVAAQVAEAEDLAGQVDDLQGQVDDLQGQLDEADSAIETQRQKLQDATSKRLTLEQDLVSANRKVEKLETKLAQRADDADAENAFYNGMVTACLDLYQQVYSLTVEQAAPYCASYVQSAMDSQAYPDNHFLREFYDYTQGIPLTPKNQKRPTLPQTQTSVGYGYGTSILGY